MSKTSMAPVWVLRGLAATTIAFVIFVAGGAFVAARMAQPYCPTEDSCHADYRGAEDGWVIVEDQP